jgi:uncharacterized protein (DUF1501 family)
MKRSTHISRRRFLQYSGLLSTAMLLPRFLTVGAESAISAGRKLVVIQLSGGNDGLNTFVPFQDDSYFSARPGIGLAPKKLLHLTDAQAMHHRMGKLADLYHSGDMLLLNSVGYPNPSRSHFRSMDIWHSASHADQYLPSGWLGRYLDNHCSGMPAHTAIELNTQLSLALKGERQKGLAFDRVQQFSHDVRYLQARPAATEHPEAAFLHKVLADTRHSAAYVREKLGGKDYRARYPNNALAGQLKQVAHMMSAGMETGIYYVSQTGYDTHALQAPVHGRLLKQYSDAVAAFAADLKRHGLWKDTLVLTFSEFGRRVAQNASSGTDHGTANNLWLLGGSLKHQGVYNPAPDLSNLDEGDLRHTIDFRQVYAGVLKGWLGVQPDSVLEEGFKELEIFLI